jgi:hypothetical protein
LGVGAQILADLTRPQTVSQLWEHSRRSQDYDSPRRLTWQRFILALDLLYAVNAVTMSDGLIERNQ